MNTASAALALRTAADALDRARSLVQDLPARFVDADSALSLFMDAPRVVLALSVIAGSLDPIGSADDIDPAGGVDSGDGRGGR